MKQLYDGLAGEFKKLSVGKTKEKPPDATSFVAANQASQWVDPGLNIRNPTQTRPEGCQTRPDLAGPNQNPGYPNSPNYLKVNFVNLYRSKI